MAERFLVYTRTTPVGGLSVSRFYVTWNGQPFSQDMAKEAARILREPNPELFVMVVPTEDLEIE